MAKRTKARGVRAKNAKKAGSRGTARRSLKVGNTGIELPPTLAQFARRVGSALGGVEKQIHTAEVAYRKQFTKLLREASRQLGRIEAQGEKRWRTLTTQARRDAAKLLLRLEKAVEPPHRKVRRKAARPQPVAAVPAPPAAAPIELTGTGI
jgi:hypothetical protein